MIIISTRAIELAFILELVVIITNMCFEAGYYHGAVGDYYPKRTAAEYSRGLIELQLVN